MHIILMQAENTWTSMYNQYGAAWQADHLGPGPYDLRITPQNAAAIVAPCVPSLKCCQWMPGLACWHVCCMMMAAWVLIGANVLRIVHTYMTMTWQVPFLQRPLNCRPGTSVDHTTRLVLPCCAGASFPVSPWATTRRASRWAAHAALCPRSRPPPRPPSRPRLCQTLTLAPSPPPRPARCHIPTLPPLRPPRSRLLRCPSPRPRPRPSLTLPHACPAGRSRLRPLRLHQTLP